MGNIKKTFRSSFQQLNKGWGCQMSDSSEERWLNVYNTPIMISENRAEARRLKEMQCVGFSNHSHGKTLNKTKGIKSEGLLGQLSEE